MTTLLLTRIGDGTDSGSFPAAVFAINLSKPSVIYVPSGLTLKKITYFSHNACMRVVRISENTAVVSLCDVT